MNTYDDALSTEYSAARDAYWKAQELFRNVAIDEIVRLLPAGVTAVSLCINDTPRLALSKYRNADGEWAHPEPYTEDGELDVEAEALSEFIDQIANDMEAYTWDEADSFLMHESDGEFVIERPEEEEGTTP